MDPWKTLDPKGPISCIPKPGGATQVSLPGETPYQCVIRWKDRAESAEARVAELERINSDHCTELAIRKVMCADRDRYRAAFLHVCESEGLNADAILARF